MSDIEFKVPIFTYHGNAMNITGTEYHNNDHVALEQDLQLIDQAGFRIVPMLWIVEVLLGYRDAACLRHAVAISFDDGPDHDFLDWDDDERGSQKSFHTILREFQQCCGDRHPDLHATCFVIASPEARAVMAQRLPRNIPRTDSWWKSAEDEGLLSVHSHSWDHLHPVLDTVAHRGNHQGDFYHVDEYGDCNQQITEAARYISNHNGGHWPTLFAYPWGQSSAYLREVYFPNYIQEHRTLAAFSVAAEPVTSHSSRWNLPRYVCGANWRSPEQFSAILTDCY